MIQKSEHCKYCGAKMESKSAKRKFCSDAHRVYWNRENKAKAKVQDLTKPKTSEVKPPPQTNTTVDTKKIVQQSEKGLTAFQIYQRKKLGLK